MQDLGEKEFADYMHRIADHFFVTQQRSTTNPSGVECLV